MSKVIHLKNLTEVIRLNEKLLDILEGPIVEFITVDTNSYRGLLHAIFSRTEVNYKLSWNEALRLSSYLIYQIEKGKSKELNITEEMIRNFPIYGINVKG